MYMRYPLGIFFHENNAYEQLVALRASDHAEPVLIDLASAIAGQGVSLIGIVAVAREDSFAASSKTLRPEPCLSLFLTGPSFRASGVDARDSNWSETWSHTNFVRENWARLCGHHQVRSQYYSNLMFVFVYNTPALDLVLLLGRRKPQIREIVATELHPAAEVFISSEPAISVVFPTRHQLDRARSSGKLAHAENLILSNLKDGDQFDCFVTGSVAVKFFDAETDASILYGLSRED